MRVTDEVFGPLSPNIVQEIHARLAKQLSDKVWDEIEEFLPEQYRGPQWPRDGVWFFLEAP